MPGRYKAPYFKVKRFTMKTITKAPILFRGGDYNPDQWLDRPDILEKDVEMMKKAGMNTATLGVFAWAKYEPQEGEYDFTWLREMMDRLYAAGIYTELATPCGAKPNWMAKKYPEILRVQANGVTVVEPDLDAFREATAYLYSDMDTTGGEDFLALRDELYAQMGIA